jgi:hypothetical protein
MEYIYQDWWNWGCDIREFGVERLGLVGVDL